jgi:hypothetical protein
MDRLGVRLIDAYRRLNDIEDFASSLADQVRAQSEMAAVQEQLEKHREECPFCRSIRWKQEVARAFRSSEPVWRGTMAS